MSEASPDGMKNCYTLKPAQAKGNKYLIRARFLYANYDQNGTVPTFDLFVGVNKWNTVKLTNESMITTMEIVHIPNTNYIFVCLVNTGYGTPFISALELRPPQNSTYRTPYASLLLFERLDIGSATNTSIRYKDDVYDRIWWPFNFVYCKLLSTSLTVDANALTAFYPPSSVMETAVTPVNSSVSLDFYLTPENPTSKFYVYMHFAEVEELQPNQTREFNITQNGEYFIGPISPSYLYSTTAYSIYPVSGDKIQYSIFRTPKSTLPPILNGLEVYMALETTESQTDEQDVNAMMSIKSKYGLKKLARRSMRTKRLLVGSVDEILKGCSSDPCKKKKKKKKTNVIPIAVSTGSTIGLLITLIMLTWQTLNLSCQNIKKTSHYMHDTNDVILSVGKANKTNLLKRIVSLEPKNHQFSYSDILTITNNFERVIGKGGFGTVYHGYLNDTQVAVKMLSPTSAQGNKEFQAEVLVVFAPNKSAYILTWEERLRIAIDAAQGLEYLHNGCKPPIIHRDIKPSNILVNQRFQAILADFGLSRVFPAEGDTHVSTIVAGTPGYLDPEYYISNWLNEKSDVYSFGVVLLEIITSRSVLVKINDRSHIIQWVSSMLQNGEIKDIVDQRLQGDFSSNSAWKALEIAMACVSPTSAKRPTMTNAVMDLKECLVLEMARRNDGYNTESKDSIELITMSVNTELSPIARIDVDHFNDNA
ncbi:putative LRR receptor-like protein kinase [Morus notabilis]|uniref:Putative LRR receptor-like protein kinase n=1 Tax=Morus notabilis TaxID=981085 RepID=W9T052_9ROSA|nr:putative LRR receptor-like protein kinase [Morus notabilis]